MPCASYKSTIKNAMLGAFKIIPLSAGFPWPVGGLVVNGNTWTASRRDTSGFDVSSNLEKVKAGDVITIQTSTGSNRLTVNSVDTSEDDYVVFSGTQSNVVGVMRNDQITGLWLQSPSGQHCIDLSDPGDVTYCDRKIAGTLDEYLAEHPEEAAAAAAYVAQFCPDIIITTPCDWTEEELAAKIDAEPDIADEALAFILENCPDCPTVNWLRGFISNRDEGFIPPGGNDPEGSFPP